jgi:hypothetical protein
MATATVLKPKPKLVQASTVKGYRPDKDGFVGAPELRDPPTGFVLKLGSRHVDYSTNAATHMPGAILKPKAAAPPDQTPTRSKVKVGRANPRFILGVGRTIIPHNGISIGNANGIGI